MATMKVSFIRCLQDSQELGSNDEHMISRVSFKLEVDRTLVPGGLFYCDVKQAVGSNYATAPLEVGQIFSATGTPYRGPISYGEFRQAVETYYRRLVGQSGSIISIGSSASNFRMRNNVFDVPWETTFEVKGTSSGW